MIEFKMSFLNSSLEKYIKCKKMKHNYTIKRDNYESEGALG